MLLLVRVSPGSVWGSYGMPEIEPRLSMLSRSILPAVPVLPPLRHFLFWFSPIFFLVVFTFGMGAPKPSPRPVLKSLYLLLRALCLIFYL